jgi:hypothetical protein
MYVSFKHKGSIVGIITELIGLHKAAIEHCPILGNALHPCALPSSIEFFIFLTGGKTKNAELYTNGMVARAELFCFLKAQMRFYTPQVTL